MELVYYLFRHHIAILVALKNLSCFLKLVLRFVDLLTYFFLFEMTHYPLNNVTRVPHHNIRKYRGLGLGNAIHYS